jgi:hypothetical protein
MQIMKVLVLGVSRMHGLSQKSVPPKPYDMCRLAYATPLEPVTSANRTLLGFGFEPQDVDLSTDALNDFSGIKFPCYLDITVEPNPTNLRRNICTGLSSLPINTQAKSA